MVAGKGRVEVKLKRAAAEDGLITSPSASPSM